MSILLRRLATLALVTAIALPAGIALAAPQGGAPDGAPGSAPVTGRVDAPAQPGATFAPRASRERHELRERTEHRGEARRGETGRHEHRHAARTGDGDGNGAMRSGDRIRHD